MVPYRIGQTATGEVKAIANCLGSYPSLRSSNLLLSDKTVEPTYSVERPPRVPRLTMGGGPTR